MGICGPDPPKLIWVGKAQLECLWGYVHVCILHRKQKWADRPLRFPLEKYYPPILSWECRYAPHPQLTLATLVSKRDES